MRDRLGAAKSKAEAIFVDDYAVAGRGERESKNMRDLCEARAGENIRRNMRYARGKIIVFGYSQNRLSRPTDYKIFHEHHFVYCLRRAKIEHEIRLVSPSFFRNSVYILFAKIIGSPRYMLLIFTRHPQRPFSLHVVDHFHACRLNILSILVI